MKKSSKRQSRNPTLRFIYFCVGALILFWAGWQFLVNPNDKMPHQYTVGPYTYRADIQPKHPKKGDLVTITVAISDVDTSLLVPETTFTTIFGKENNPQGIGAIARPPLALAKERLTSKNGVVTFAYKVDESKLYSFAIGPTAEDIKEKSKHDDAYRVVPQGATFKIYVR